MAGNTASLLAQIRLDAEKSASERRAAALLEMERARAEASAAAAHRRTAALADHAQRAIAAREAARAGLARKAASELLTARAEALDRIFAQAARELDGLAASPLASAEMARAIEQSLSYLPEGPAVVRCAAGVVEIARAVLERTRRPDTLVREDPAVPPGAITESADGAISIDATLARRLAKKRPQLSIALAAQIEGALP